jgi:hypothetical protein
MTPPDALLLGSQWPERALLRAELIEAGYDVVATESWPIPPMYRRPAMKPRVVIVDLLGLPDPRAVLDELRLVVPPDRVLVVTALGTVTIDEIRRIGYHVVTRPTSIGDIVAATRKLLRANPAVSAGRRQE